MIRTFLKLTYVVSYVATAVFALLALMTLLLSVLTGAGFGTLVVAIILLGLSIGSCVLYECIGFMIDD